MSLSIIYNAKKYVVDDRDVTSFAKKDIKVFINDGKNLSMFKNNSLDVVFASNFCEHLKSKDDLLTTLQEIKRVLKQRGSLIILQPNIKYAYKEYWDFFDHYLPLSHMSMLETLNLVRFSIVEVRKTFLPYTIKSRFPKSENFIKLYLRFPLLHKIYGKQMLIVAEKTEG